MVLGLPLIAVKGHAQPLLTKHNTAAEMERGREGEGGREGEEREGEREEGW